MLNDAPGMDCLNTLSSHQLQPAASGPFPLDIAYEDGFSHFGVFLTNFDVHSVRLSLVLKAQWCIPKDEDTGSTQELEFRV